LTINNGRDVLSKQTHYNKSNGKKSYFIPQGTFFIKIKKINYIRDTQKNPRNAHHMKYSEEL